MSSDPADRDFDWVTGRHTCTARQTFPRLRDLAERSVETRAAQIRDDRFAAPLPKFVAENNGTPTFCVTCGSGPDPEQDPRVRFRLVDRLTIRVDGSGLGGEPFDVSVEMDDSGRCVLLVAGDARLDWQILRRALDHILFG